MNLGLHTKVAKPGILQWDVREYLIVHKRNFTFAISPGTLHANAVNQEASLGNILIVRSQATMHDTAQKGVVKGKE